MKYLFVFIALFVFVCFSLDAQSVISRKDIVIVEAQKELTEKDQQILSNYNFDEYRFLNLRKKIQLVNGPLIELLSLKEIKSMGISVSRENEKKISKKNEDFKHELTLQLNIGLGIYEAYEPK